MDNFDIKSIDLFKGLKGNTLNLLEEYKKVELYKKGEYLFFNRDEIDDIYFIIRGKVTLYKYTQRSQKRIIYILGENEFINEVIFDNLPSSINAEAFEDTIVIKYKVDDFKKIMESDFDLTMKIINSLGRKVRRLYRQIKNTVPISLDKKVAAKLWKLARDYGIKYAPLNDDELWTAIDLKITITYIANMLGNSRETISREMKKLEEQNLIKWQGRRLLVRKEKLSNYFKND